MVALLLLGGAMLVVMGLTVATALGVMQGILGTSSQ